MISDADIENWFTYHPPTEEQRVKYQHLRDAAKDLAKLIRDCTPTCPDQTVAIRKLREAIFTANAAIACGGK